MVKQARLPGTEDAAIQELEDNADAYMEARDQRLAILKDEVDLKGKILSVMKAHKKSTYRRGDYIIKIRVEKEKLLVKKKSDRKKKLAA